jgi:hypothetical protein
LRRNGLVARDLDRARRWGHGSAFEEAILADGDYVIGWAVDRVEREVLLDRISPAYPDVIANHVTLQAKVDGEAPLPAPARCEIIGVADDGLGVQALVVRMDGTTDRPDGSTFHITWSIDKARGRRASHSNEVIARLGWRNLPRPLPVSVRPARFP